MDERAAPRLFDRARVKLLRARAAPRLADCDFLHRRAMADIIDRLESVTRDFPRALLYGAGDLAALITPACKIGAIVAADLAAERLAGRRGAGVVADEERSPFAPESFDLIVSLLTLHAANDLIGALAQWRRALRPDGLFIGALFGEETLGAARRALYAAESETRGGAGARFSPLASVRDLGGALQRAGFALPVADLDTVEISYRDPRRLLADLRGMGETGALASRPPALTREIAARFYAALDGAKTRFDIVYLTGWAPHPDQQRPLAPGSAKASLAEAVKRAGG